MSAFEVAACVLGFGWAIVSTVRAALSGRRLLRAQCEAAERFEAEWRK